MMLLPKPNGVTITTTCSTSPTLCSSDFNFLPTFRPNHHLSLSSLRTFPTLNSVGILAAAVVLAAPPPSPSSEETLGNILTELSGESCESKSMECEKTKKRIQRPKSREAERCTSKCVTTCIRGGDGAPGEGPLNVRGPIVVFKQGFRSRQYCLVECSDICNLLDDADKGR